MRARLVLAAGTAAFALAGSVFAASPALAGAGDTVATFSITGAAAVVTMSVPDGSATPVALGSATSGAATVSGSLGAVTVTDNRAKLAPVWTVDVSSTSFDLQGSGVDLTDPKQTVPATNITYATGTATLSGPGAGTFTGLAATALSAPRTAGAYTGTGSRTATWNPTLVFTLNSGQVAGTYKGTVTHSLTTVS